MSDKNIATIDFDMPKTDDVILASDPRIIKVVGVGGGGGNAVARMYEEGMHDVRFEVCNTDRMDLEKSPVPVRRQLGTEGLGAGSDPRKGRSIAEDSLDEIDKMFCDGTRMVFITAGMGGGTGTGAAPVIAREAQKAGMLTVGIVTIPFALERESRIDRALDGVYELSKHVDSLLVINNERLRDICALETLKKAFRVSDETLMDAVRSIADIITTPMQINVDFNDVCTVLRNGGVALISTGEAEGETRVRDALQKAVESPLLNNNDVFNARKVLLIIYTSEKDENTLTIAEMNYVNEFMNNFVDPGIEVKLGFAYLPDMGKKVKITLLASGFGLDSQPYMAKRIYKDENEAGSQDEIGKIDKEVRRNKIYGKKKRSYFIYKFSDSDLDNDIVIDQVADTGTSTRNAEVYKRIRKSSNAADVISSSGEKDAEKNVSSSNVDDVILFNS